jgi:hypothetical protein
VTRYAQGTTIGVGRTIEEIRSLLLKHGATHFASGETPELGMVQFAIRGRHYRFEVRRPTWDDVQGFYADPRRITAAKAIDDEWRRRWRARLLWTKAQLEFAEGEAGVLEEALLAHLVLPDGRTMGSWASPQIEAAYERGGMPALLGEGTR